MSIADDLVDALAPWMTPDLEVYARAIGEMFSEVELYAITGDDDQGWTVLFDPDRCPAPALPYLAQYVGERLPVGISEPAAREWIKDAPNQRRGTPQSIFLAAQRKLTGSRLVSMRERDGGDPDKLTVVTYTHETPDPDGTLADLLDVVPHDIDLTYSVLDGEDWGGVATDHATWTDVETAFPTWADVASAMSGATTFSRPVPT
jgi:hypothetical protein